MLIVHEAKPIVDGILARSRKDALRTEDLDDISANVSLRLVRRLQTIPGAASEAIANFGDFVARLTYNAVHDVLRRRFPQRTRLKNRLRYVLDGDQRFATWETAAGAVAGLRSWRGRAATPAVLTKQQANARMMRREDTAAAIEAVLLHFGEPVLFDDLFRIFIEIWDVSDRIPSNVAEQETSSNPLSDLEKRQHLGALWREIQDLPPRQRIALLLNLRDADGYNAAILFVLAGVARFEQIAAAVEMSDEQLTAIWNDLPIDDLTIAGMLGVTRQQVINLRKSARERLARRMKP